MDHDCERRQPDWVRLYFSSQHETFERLINWYVAAEPEFGSRL
jgi:hypothetical protein